MQPLSCITFQKKLLQLVSAVVHSKSVDVIAFKNEVPEP